MDKYYVSGCKDNGSEIETCDDSEATFWTLYERDGKGLSQGIVDLRFREDAEAVKAVYVERDALQEQVKALAAENSSLKSVVNECREYFIAGIRNTIRPTNEGYLHMICDTVALGTLATDAAIREIKAQGVDDLLAYLPPLYTARSDIGRYAAQLRAKPEGEQPCCAPSVQELKLLAAGDFTPEELWGVGGKPSCPKCSGEQP
jgi:hypothetical protein